MKQSPVETTEITPEYEAAASPHQYGPMTALSSRGPAAIVRQLLDRARASQLWRLESALIAGAVVLGLGSAWLSEANREAANRDLIERLRVTQIVVAGQDLSSGSRIDSSSVRYAEALASQVTRNAVDPEALRSVLGRTLTIDLKEGDPLLLTAIEGTGAANAVAAKIPPGKRLVTLQVRDKAAQKGWIHPNDRVDIIATMILPGRGQTTFTLLQDITLVSVGKASVWNEGQTTEGTEIGFYASPRDVEFIAFAEKHGEFSLAMRNPTDAAHTDPGSKPLGSDGIDFNKFLDHASISRASGGGDLPVYVQGQAADSKAAEAGR